MNTSTLWDDMPNDLDAELGAAPTVVTAEMATQTFVTPRPLFTEVCGKCSGTGRYYRVSQYGLQCFACKGAGSFSRKTSPEQRAKAKATAAARAERKRQEELAALQERAARWGAENVEAFSWINTSTSSFAESLRGALQRFGSLTVGQLNAVAGCIERDRAKATAAAQAPQAPSDMLPALHSVMQRHARLYAGDLTLSRRNGDQLVWIKHANSERVIGKLDGGKLSLWHRPGVDNAEVRAVLDEFEGAPLQAAMKFGKLAGRCCSCGRDLTDPASIDAGIGPICAQKF